MVFLATMLSSVMLVSVYLWVNGVYPDFAVALRFALFNTISVGTTTGYSTDDYNLWPLFAPLWILFLGTFAACSGSTGGGIKMIRAIVLYRQIYRDLVRLLHPSAIIPVKVAGQRIPDDVIVGVLAFFFIWTATLITTMLLLAATGLDLRTASSAAVASLSNIGPGLHGVGPATTYSSLNDLQTWICTAAMLLGRLELFTLLVIFTPAFWRK
jgi:trk system potassium uptake protein TrkH